MGKRKNPRLEAAVAFAAVLIAAVLAAFIRSKVTGQSFSLDWVTCFVTALACAAVTYLGPALWYHFVTSRRRNGSS